MVARVYSYMRFSDPRQSDGHSSERQAAYAARWANENGLTLDDTLTLRDEGLSAYHQRHVSSGALGAFLAAIEAGRIVPGSTLVVEGLDRLSRAEPIQAQAQLAQIINAGISVVTAVDGKVYSREALKANPMDLLYALLVMIRAHEESDTKSKRVKASIAKQCQDWIDGKYRGIIRNGRDPQWLRLDENQQWQPIPERVEALRLVISMYTQGYGAGPIIDAITERNMQVSDRPLTHERVYQLIKSRSIMGERDFTIDGHTYVLQNYYPAAITQSEWDDMRATAATRAKGKVKGTFPPVITGHGFTFCGYCGYSMVSQHITHKKRSADGLIVDGNIRVRCNHNFQGAKHHRCNGGGSCSAVPIEKAIVRFCSDMLNLQALYGGDRTAAPRAKLVELRKQMAEIEAKLERLTDAMLDAKEDGGVPAAFAKRARAMEEDLAKLKDQATTAEAEVATSSRLSLDGADDAWRQVAEGMAKQDYHARMRARQLVRDTFERIVIYWAGIRSRDPDMPKGSIDVLLMAKGGTARLIRVAKDGSWVAGEELITGQIAA